MSTLTLNEKDTLLLIVDVQERLAPAMNPELYGALIENVRRFGAARSVLDLATVVTEQYPKGLGATVAPIRDAFEGVAAHKKISFSAMGDEGIAKAIEAAGRQSVVVAGMETHICVYQTVRDLVDAGFRVHVLADAVASRSRDNHAIGLALMEKAGASISSTEMVLFDLLGRAGTDAFKTISKLVR
jgi:nicotinamidase-related amidase